MSHYQTAIARVQEIESRLGMAVDPPALSLPSNVPSRASEAMRSVSSSTLHGLPGTGGASQPFNVMLGEATGNVKLQRVGNGGPPFAPYIEGLINRYAGQNGLSPALVRAVIRQESDGNPRDVSHAGARGLMQLMPEEIQELGVTDPFDPEQNIAAGTRLLSGLLKQYKGDLPLALAAYNAGSGAVQKYKGIPPYPETQDYVRKITGLLEKE